MYHARRGDYKPGKEPKWEGDELDHERYTLEGLARQRRGRWLDIMAVPYLLLLAWLTGFL